MYEYSTKGELAMPTVRLLRNGQVTLPAKVRQDFALADGTYLDVEIENNRIVLIPKTLVKKDKAKEKIFEILDEVWERNKDVDPKEVKKLVNQAVKEVRAKKRQ
jgi:AbrB family looped-hinge helix DNA binding protein